MLFKIDAPRNLYSRQPSKNSHKQLLANVQTRVYHNIIFITVISYRY